MIRITGFPSELLRIILTYLTNNEDKYKQCPDIYRFLQADTHLYHQFIKSQRQITLHCRTQKDCHFEMINTLIASVTNPYKQFSITVWNDWAGLLSNNLMKNPNPSTFLELKELYFLHTISNESISIISQTHKLSSLSIYLSMEKNLVKKLEEVLHEKARSTSFGLKQLQLRHYHETNFTLPYFIDLEELTLQSPRSTTFNILSSYQNIQKLTIAYYSQSIDLSVLSNIHDLVLTKCSAITDVSFLCNNHSIEIRECWNVYDYTTGFGKNSVKISIFNKREDLKLKINIAYFLKIKSLMISCFDFEGVSGHKIITDVVTTTLQYCFLQNIYPLQPSNLANIKILHLREIEQLEKLHGFGSSRQIFVEISYCDYIIDFSALKYVPHVIINGCKGFNDCMQLEGVKHLQILNCKNVKNIGGSNILEHLELYNCEGCCSFIWRLKSLQVLTVNYFSEKLLDYIRTNNPLKIVYKKRRYNRIRPNIEIAMHVLQERYIPVHQHRYFEDFVSDKGYDYTYLLKDKFTSGLLLDHGRKTQANLKINMI